MNKWAAGPAQSKKSSKGVLSFIYLFKSRRSARIYLFIHCLATVRHLFFLFFHFCYSAGDRPSFHLFIQEPVTF